MGIFQPKSIVAQSAFIPKNEYTEDKMPDQHGKVIIVTGANTGIGLETSRVLLKKGAKVYLAARNPEKAQAAIKKLEGEIPDAAKEGRIQFLELDLADLKKVRKAAKEFKQKETKLDVLFNSGGVMMPPATQKTADGYDLQFGTNVLGHFAFTTALLPLLVSTAEKSGSFVRVINTSSSVHVSAPKQGIVFDNINLDGYGTTTKYAHSKIGNVFFADELGRRYKEKGVFSASLNPGNIKSDLQRHIFAPAQWLMQKVMLYPVELGAVTQLYAGTSPDVKLDDTTAYYVPWARKADTNHAAARDAEVGKKLWEWCEGEVKKVTGEEAVPSA